MGNPAIAIPALKELHHSSHDVLAVVSNPPKPMGRGRIPDETSVVKTAIQLGLPLFQPVSLTDSDFIESIKVHNPDLFVVVAFRILPEILLTIPRKGSINLHTSWLPKYRGAAPIQRVLMNGESETGLTTFLIEPKVDRGAILLRKKVIIEPEEDCGMLTEKMALMGADLLLETVDKFEQGTLKPRPQNPGSVSWAPKIKPEDCLINWSWTAEKIHNLIRAMSPKPGAHTFLKQRRFKIFKSEVIKTEKEYAPGTVVNKTKQHLFIGTGFGLLKPLIIQLEGKRQMSIEDYLRGAPIEIGQYFG
ncbi:MAG: methionyl-tRNA formyltransferase [Fidelibacterota bacterium]